MLNYDAEILTNIFKEMTHEQSREFIIKWFMSKQGKTFQALAKPRRISTWYLDKAVCGKAPWNPKIVNALEKGLKIDVTGFLTDAERVRNGR